MSSNRQNCWEYMKCGREPGGDKAAELEACPAATDKSLDGINFGTNGGKICWALVGTFCAGEVQGTFAEKLDSCTECDFYQTFQKPAVSVTNNRTGVIEKRKHQRFKVKEGAFAKFHRHRIFKLGKSRVIESAPIIDISYKGLAFQYTDRNMWSLNFNELSISRITDEVKIDKVPYKAVSDFIISDVAYSKFLRRCSVKFGELTSAQKSQLDHFIQNHTIGNRRSGFERRQFLYTDHGPERRSDKNRRKSHRNWRLYK